MTITPPENLAYATITHRLLRTIVDTGDADRLPNVTAAEDAIVTITPRVTQYKNLALPATFITTQHRGTYDAAGYLRDEQGNLGIVLTAPDGADISPNGWQYTVQIQAAGTTFPAFPITVHGGQTYDLTLLSPAAPAAGVVTVVSEQSRILAQQAAAEARAIADDLGQGIETAVEEYLIANPPEGGTGGPVSDANVSVIVSDAGSDTRQAINTIITSYGFASEASTQQALAGKANTIHSHTKNDVGLGNVDNTSDANKPISAAVSTALSGKSNTGHTHVAANITDFNTTVDSRIEARLGVAPAALDTFTEFAAALGNDSNFASTTAAALAAKAPINNPTFTGTVGGITKAMVGLSAVDNTSDAAKPVSTAQLNALNQRVVVVNHGSVANTTRPAGASSVHWIGTVTPLNMTDADIYVGPSGLAGGGTGGGSSGPDANTAGYRFRINSTTWEPRPTGYKLVIAVGADPSPTDQQANDQRLIPQ
jgi:hypothetical protein